MRPATTTTTNEALQNVRVGRSGASKFCAGLFGGAHSAGTEASVTDKGGYTEVQGGSPWCKQVR